MSVLILESTGLMKELENRKSQFYEGIRNVYKVIQPLLDQRIAQVFTEYTQHDSKHSLRIIQHMESIIGDISLLNDFEIALLVYVALLHDIGMAASEEEITKIKSEELTYESISYKVILEKYSSDEKLAIQDILRRVHAQRSSMYVKEQLKSVLIIPNMISVSFEKEVALICEAHTKDILWVKENLGIQEIKGDYRYNLQYCALVLRLADILDFDSQRTPWKLYESIAPKGYSQGEWLQHYVIENNNKITLKEGGQKVVEFYGTCNDPIIHRKILSYIDWINIEIENANDLSRGYEAKHKLNFYYKVNNFITSEEYAIVDLKFQVNYKRMLALLMGEELYGSKELGLRELVQNSIDACRLRKEIYDNNNEPWEDEYTPKVWVILDKFNNEVIIKDNGIGMNMTILKKYFLELGASYYNSDDYLLSNFNYVPIGNYGIGFLASFMLSDVVKVRTRQYNESMLIEIDIFKDDEYVCIRNKENHEFKGTEIILNYNDFFNVWQNKKMIIDFINKEFLVDNINISVIDKEEKSEVIQIKNTFSSDSKNVVISLSKYLDEVNVELSVYGDIKNKIFKRNFKEISYHGEPFIFYNDELYQIDDIDKYEISEFLEDGKLSILNFLVIEDSDELENLMDYFDDSQEGKSKFEEKYEPIEISLIVETELLKSAPKDYRRVDEIVEGLSFEDFEKYGIEHDNASGTFFDLQEKNFYSMDDYELYIPLTAKVNIREWMRRNTEKQKLYIRDVYVKNLNLSVENGIEGLFFEYLNVNVINKRIKPNVNRTDIKKDDNMLLLNSIYQALCLHIYEQLDNQLEKSMFLGYIRKYHNYVETLLKPSYSEIINGK